MTNADRRPNVSRREASDVERYRRMRQERENANPVRRAGHEVGRRLEGAGGVGGGLRESGEYRRQGFSPARGGRSNVGAYAGQRPQGRRAPRPAKPRNWARTAKRVLVGVLAVLLAFSVVLKVRLGSGVSLETRAALSPTLPGTPFYMLLVGTDKSEQRVEDGSTGGTFRTDSIMLARVDPLAAKLTLVSIQRDTLVDLGGSYGKQKINAAYTLGGAPLLIHAVSDLAGVKICLLYTSPSPRDCS